VSIQATIADGKLNARLPTFKAYDGSGAGTLDVDASSGTPTQAFSFNLTNLNAYPFLKDAAGFQRIEGTGAVAIEVKSKGASQRAIVSALSGTAKFSFTDGAIRGVNIAKMARNLTTNVLSGWGDNAAEKTDFAMLGANFKIAQGIAETSDLQLVGPFVRMTGSGKFDMPAQTLEFKIDPMIVASREGQGGKADLEGLGVPVVVSGSWGRPRIYPDIAGILQNPTAAYDRLRQLGGGLFKLPAGSAARALGAALGGVAGGADGPGGAAARDAIGGAIGNIFDERNVDLEATGAINGANQAPRKLQQAAPEPVKQPAGAVNGALQAPKLKKEASATPRPANPNETPTSDATKTDKQNAKKTPAEADAAANQRPAATLATQGDDSQTEAPTGAQAKPNPKTDAEQLIDLLGN
jgi:AsmA protein